MKKILCLLIAAATLAVPVFTGCRGGEDPAGPDSAVRVFTDSLGRSVELPARIGKFAVSGPLAQIALFALAPDRMVGVAIPWTDAQKQYIPREYHRLPELGQLYGGKGELNLETLLGSGAEVVIDVGEPKEHAGDDLDALQEQTGIPFVHVTCRLDNMGEAYRRLGELLGCPDEAGAIAAFCERSYDRALEIAGRAEKKKVLYCTGPDGRSVLAKTSFHAEIVDLLADNLAVLENPSPRGTGNETSLEQILAWDPEIIIFAPGGAYDSVGDDPAWQAVRAIRNGTYYEVPDEPYNWMNTPPSVQRTLGLNWFPALLYPEETDYDLFRETAECYRLFYHHDLTGAEYDGLVADSIGRRDGGGGRNPS